jgi:membrane protein YdbS with pleckstrin-like domain
MSDNVSFRSKVDAWLIAVIAAAVVFAAVQGFLLWEASPEGSVISWSVAALAGAIFIAVAVPCRYTLERDHLHIRSGFIQQRIAYKDITGVEPSRNPLSAPALSLQRVKVSYGGRFQLVSPLERERFIQLLEERVARTRGLRG